MDLNAILAKARKKKLEAEEHDRKKRTDEMRAELDDLSRKAKSADVQNTTYQKDRLEAQKKLGELRTLEKYLDIQEYDEAESSILNELNELEERLQSHKALVDALNRQISSMQVAISSVSSSRTLVAGEPFADDYIMSAYNKSRDSIQQAYDEVKSLKDLLAACGKDLKLIHCHCRIAAGNLRILQDEIDPPATAAEQMVLRRAFGTIGSLVKEYMCGIISALGRDRKEDWVQFVNQARLERDKILAEKTSVLRTNVESAEKFKATPVEPKQEPQINVPFEAINRVKDKKLVFFGGDKEVPLLVDFAKDVLMAKRVTWYESKKNDYDAMMTSISAGGPDIVVMLNLWSSHKFSSPIIAACKKKGIPFVELLSSSREALRDQLISNKGVAVAS